MNKDTQKNIKILNKNNAVIKEISNIWLSSITDETLYYSYMEDGLTYHVSIDIDNPDIGGVMIQDE